MQLVVAKICQGWKKTKRQLGGEAVAMDWWALQIVEKKSIWDVCLLRPMQPSGCSQSSDCTTAFEAVLQVCRISHAEIAELCWKLFARILLSLPQQQDSAQEQVGSTRPAGLHISLLGPTPLDLLGGAWLLAFV